MSSFTHDPRASTQVNVHSAPPTSPSRYGATMSRSLRLRSHVSVCEELPGNQRCLVRPSREPPDRLRMSPDRHARDILAAMRIASGKVVSGKVVVDGEPLAEGATVTVLAPDDDEAFDLTPEEESLLLASIRDAEQGRIVEASVVLRDLGRR